MAASSPHPTSTSSSHVYTPATLRNGEKMPTRSKNAPQGKQVTDTTLLIPSGRCQVETKTLPGCAPNPGATIPWCSQSLR